MGTPLGSTRPHSCREVGDRTAQGARRAARSHSDPGPRTSRSMNCPPSTLSPDRQRPLTASEEHDRGKEEPLRSDGSSLLIPAGAQLQPQHCCLTTQSEGTPWGLHFRERMPWGPPPKRAPWNMRSTCPGHMAGKGVGVGQALALSSPSPGIRMIIQSYHSQGSSLQP